MAPNDPRRDPLDQVDWEEACVRMKRVIAANLKGRIGRTELDDLAQDACVGLMRAVLRGPILSLEAVEVTIAKRVAIDCMRRPNRTDPLTEGDPGMPAVEAENDWMTADDAQFYVREIMRSIGAACRELFEHWLATLNLRAVAERIGVSHDTARQRYVRCRGQARKICLRDDGPLGDWARQVLETE